jgi:hypothetical protein
MVRRSIAVVAAALALVAGVATTRTVHVVEQWALYTSNGPNQPLRLFLDPFPAKKYCQYDADQVVHDGGRAECRSRVSLTLDRRPADQLVWTFVTEWAKLCGTPQVADD